MSTINKININGIDYDIEDKNKATKTSQLENDSKFISQLKTVNGQSLEGEGDIEIEGGSGDTLPINAIFEYDGDVVPEGYEEVEEEPAIVEETDPTVPEYVKAITQEDIEKWNSGTASVGDTLPINSIFAYEGDDIPEGYEEVQSTMSNSNVYKKEETVVGTWIDGRPIYQITLEITTTTMDARYYLRDLEITNIRNVWLNESASFVGYRDVTYCGILPVNNFISTSDYKTCYIDADQRLTLKSGSAGTLYWTVTLRYTKTTD